MFAADSYDLRIDRQVCRAKRTVSKAVVSIHTITGNWLSRHPNCPPGGPNPEARTDCEDPSYNLIVCNR